MKHNDLIPSKSCWYCWRHAKKQTEFLLPVTNKKLHQRIQALKKGSPKKQLCFSNFSGPVRERSPYPVPSRLGSDIHRVTGNAYHHSNSFIHLCFHIVCLWRIESLPRLFYTVVDFEMKALLKGFYNCLDWRKK